MGGKSQARAQAAQARETARQYEDLKRRAGKIKYNQAEVLKNLKAASEIVPEIAGLYEAVQRDPSAMEDIQTDPRLQEIMKGNLEAVQEMAEEGGMTSEDKAKRRQLQREASASAKARDKSIVREMAQRGQAGSGTELLARLGASQAAAQREAEATDRLAMDSAAARRAAIAQASQQASGMQAQSFGQQAQKASAADQIAAFNAMQRQRAQDDNLAMRQQRENIKAQQAAGYYQGAAQTEQQRFANEMSKLGMQSNLTGAAGQARMAGVAPKTNWGQIAGTAIGAGIGAKFGKAAGATAGAQIGGAVGGARDGGVKYGNGGTKYSNGTEFDSMMAGLVPPKQQEEIRPEYVTDPNREPISKPKEPSFRTEQVTDDSRIANPKQELTRPVISEPVIDKKPPSIKKSDFVESDMDYSAAYDKAKKEDRLDESPDKIKKELKEGDNKEAIAGALGAMAKGIGEATKPQAAPQLSAPQMDASVKSLPIQMAQPMGGINPMGIAAEDGAVKMSPEDMRDILMSEVNAFACGGVKKDYEDGGISPELREATQMLRTNKPAPASPMPGGQPPMPADPNMMPPQAPQGAPMAPPMDPNMMPPQGAPMPPQGQMMADGGMAYEDGGEGTIIPGESYEGDQLPDRINSGEMVLNVEQQDRLNDQLQELKRLKSKERTDKMLADGTAEVNPEQQEAIMSFVRGEIDIDELPSERVVKEPSVGEPTGRMAELLGMLGKRRKG
jgi:hypothetical protein